MEFRRFFGESRCVPVFLRDYWRLSQSSRLRTSPFEDCTLTGSMAHHKSLVHNQFVTLSDGKGGIAM